MIKYTVDGNVICPIAVLNVTITGRALRNVSTCHRRIMINLSLSISGYLTRQVKDLSRLTQ